MEKQRIYLIGFMGTGKSTVAKALKRKTGYPVKEMDSELVKICGMDIASVFARYGEEYFRNKETELLKTIACGDSCIVSCGGGVALREENIRVMEESGTAVLLTARPETVYHRVCRDTGRPLLKNRMSPEGIRELMEERRQAYEKACSVKIATDGRTPDQIAEEIINKL